MIYYFRNTMFFSPLVSFTFRMLDDLAYEMEVTESKLDATTTKIAKALHMTSGKFFFFC